MKYLKYILLILLLSSGCTKDETAPSDNKDTQMYGEQPGAPASQEDSVLEGSGGEVQKYNAVATLKKDAKGEWCLQVSEDYLVYPLNVERIDLPEMTRVTTRFYVAKIEGDKVFVVLTDFDGIETKDMEKEYDPAFGPDPLDVVDDWRTSVEDGFLTVRYKTWWGNNAGYHDLRLYPLEDPENPYRLVLRQDDGGDAHDYTGDALVAFRLDDLPETEEEVNLTVEYLSLEGTVKTFTFKYTTPIR